MKRSRLWGMALGGLLGAGIGLGITFYLYGANADRLGWPTRLVTALVVGALGALLGSLSGVSSD
jgi:hypothetical protein